MNRSKNSQVKSPSTQELIISKLSTVSMSFFKDNESSTQNMN